MISQSVLSIIKYRIFALLLILLLPAVLIAQYDPELLDELKETYPGSKYIMLESSSSYTLDLKGGELEVTLEETEKYIYLEHIPFHDAKESIFSSHFRRLDDFDVMVYNLDNGKYRREKVKDYNEIHNTQEGSFYDDVKEYSFSLPGVKEGSIIEISSEHSILDGRMLPGAYLANVFPIHELNVVFDCDEAIALELIEWNLKEGLIRKEIKNESGRKRVHYQGQNIPPFKEEDNMPPFKYFLPHLVPLVRSVEEKGEEIAMLRDTRTLYDWYYSFISGIWESVDKTALRKLSDSLTRDCSTELGKVESIYQWVQSNIKYVDFEYGMGGLIPRKPDEVLLRRFGDCKDKSTLLHSLLQLAGVESHLSWTGSRELPYTYSEVPSPATDDHMIVTYIHGDDYYFLDPTSRYHHISIPSSFTQGKETLISISKDSFLVKKIPVVPVTENFRHDSVFIHLEGRTVKGRGLLRVGGYEKIRLQEILMRPESPGREEALEGYLRKGSNRFVLEDYEPSAFPDFERRMEIRYHFSIGDYVNAAGDMFYIDLNLIKRLLGIRLEEDRTSPLMLRNTIGHRLNLEFEVPDGFEVFHLPPEHKFEDGKFGFSTSYRQDGNLIAMDYMLRCDQVLITEEDFERWREFIDKLEDSSKETVILRQ